MKRHLAGSLILVVLAAIFLAIVLIPPDIAVPQIVLAIFALLCFVVGLVSLILFAVHLIFDDPE